MGRTLRAVGVELLVLSLCIACRPTPRAAVPETAERVGPSALARPPGSTTTRAPAPAVSSVATSDAPLDSDRDGIVDSEDRCPQEPGARSPRRERWGCPSLLPVEVDGIILTLLPFARGSTKLDTRQALPLLSELATELKGHPRHCLLVVGYADARSDPPPLASLRLKRAGAVQKYLVDHGVPPERLATDGADDPCTTEPLNHDGRRVSLRMLRCPFPSPLPQLECRHKNGFFRFGELDDEPPP